MSTATNHHKNETPRRAVDIAHAESAKSNGFSLWFSGFAAKTSAAMGSPTAFLLAILVVIVWAVTGPLYNYSDSWQLVINTGTTIVTFLMVFLIQNTQNRDAKAIHLKLNELIHAGKKAHDELIDIEKLSDEELKQLDTYYERIREECERRDHRKREDLIRSQHATIDSESDSRNNTKSDAKTRKTA